VKHPRFYLQVPSIKQWQLLFIHLVDALSCPMVLFFFVFWHAPPGGIAKGSNSKWRPCRPFKWSIVLPSPPRICWGIADCGQPIWGACGLSGHTDRRPSSRPARQRPQSMQALLPSCHRAQPVNHTPFIPKSSDPSQSHLCAAGTCGGN